MVWTDRIELGGASLARFVALHRRVYRASGGRFLTRARGKPIALLTTTGRRSGRRHTVPLPYLPGGETLVVIASNSGLDRHPAWYLNLVANPEVEVQVGPRAVKAMAVTATGGDRARLWERILASAPWYAEYQSRTDREIPLVVVTPSEPVGHDAPTGFDRPRPAWWIAVLGGMSLLGFVALDSRGWRWWSRHVTDAVPRVAYRALFGAAVATHLVEAGVAARRAERSGLHSATLRWTAQTALLGFPSLRLLLRRTAAPPTAN